MGRHRVLARSADGASDVRTVDLAGGDVAEVSLVLGAPKSQPVAAQADNATDHPWSMKRKLAVSSWGAGALLIGGGIASGMLAVKSDDELSAMLETFNVDQSEVADARSALKRRSITADVLIGTGAAAVVSGTLWLLARRDDKRPSPSKLGKVELSWDVGLGSMRLDGRF